LNSQLCLVIRASNEQCDLEHNAAHMYDASIVLR